MDDLNDVIKRLKRAGIRNARATERLYQAAWRMAEVCRETSTEDEDKIGWTNVYATYLELCAQRSIEKSVEFEKGVTQRQAAVKAQGQHKEGQS
jgi:hypothetical protein